MNEDEFKNLEETDITEKQIEKKFACFLIQNKQNENEDSIESMMWKNNDGRPVAMIVAEKIDEDLIKRQSPLDRV